MNNNELHFKTNIHLKSIIGKDLINDDNIAILELVKNSFDADAKKVIVKYLNLKDNDDNNTNSFSDNTSRIIIKDNGIGMNLDSIKNKWLNIAYSEKKSNKKQHNRRMAGAKGVGRFSCDRLGEYLNLYAKTKNDNEYVKLSIDWKIFEVEDENKEIQTIPLKYEYLTDSELINFGFKPFEQGVLLEIIKLRSSWVYQIKNKNEITWDVKKLIELKKYLEKLINPNQQFQNDDFGVYLDAPEFEKENKKLPKHERFIGEIQNRIFDKLDFKATSIESKTIDNGENIYTVLKDKGQTIFWIKEKNSFYPFLNNVKTTIYFLNPYAKSFFTKQTGIRSVDYGSIFLFINGFRVPPYGEVGNDWLRLDQRKTQGHSRYIGLRDVIGQIEILDENNNFQIISSREGVVNNDNFIKLTSSDRNDSFFFKAFRRLEKYVVNGLNWDKALDNNGLHNIHNKIVLGELDENELQYLEDIKTKQQRVYNSIHSIISAKTVDVKELYINEKLITQKIEEEREKSEREFQQLIEDFENKKIDPETLNRILQKKAEQNAELEKQLKEFSKYNTSEATSKAILELQKYKTTIENQAKLINQLQEKLDNLQKEKEKAENTATSYQKKAEKAESDLKIEKEKNLYLLATRRTLSPDAEGLIHTIKLNNIEIKDGIDNIIDDLTENDFNINDLIERLGFLNINAQRSLKMSEFATRSDFKEDIEKRDVDVVKYIMEYVTLYGDVFSNNISFHFSGEDSALYKNLSVLNLSIVIDNLISNASKWEAKNMLFEFHNNSEKELILNIYDNGMGLADKFLNNPNKIFELSVREIPPSKNGGSGIGLFFTKDLLNDMNSSIEFIGNNLKLKGAGFRIIFKTI